MAGQDSNEQTSTVRLVIAPACRLSIADNDVSKTITADNNAASAFSNGYVEFEPNKPTLTIDSNKKWKLSISSAAFTGPYNKNINDLMVKDISGQHVTPGFEGYNALSKSDQDMASCASGVKGELHPLQYKILLNWEKDVPGTYEAVVTYTLSTLGS